MSYLHLDTSGPQEDQFTLVQGSTFVSKCIGPIKGVNLIIGPNNARKSRFMREILRSKARHISPTIALEELESLNDFTERLVHGIPDGRGLVVEHSIGDFNRNTYKVKPDEEFEARFYETHRVNGGKTDVNRKYFEEFGAKIHAAISIRDTKSINELKDYIERVKAILELIRRSHSSLSDRFQGRMLSVRRHDSKVYQVLYAIQHDELIGLMSAVSAITFVPLSPHFHYVPALRTSLQLQEVEGNRLKLIDSRSIEYTYRTLYDLNQQYNVDRITFYSGMNLYDLVKDYRLNKRPTRRKFDEFEKFIGSTFFGSKGVDIVPDGKANEIHYFSGRDSEDERFLHDVGDGIQSLIVLVLPLFMSDNADYIIIEEPENHMHPGLLSVFMNSLLKAIEKSSKKVFVVSHSNVVLEFVARNSSSASVFKFTPSLDSKNESIIMEMAGDYLDLLDDLGVSNLSVLLANCAIWVEGPTDRIVIQAMIEAYCKANSQSLLNEGLDYAYFIYGGSILANYEMPGSANERIGPLKLRHLANKAFVIVDQDESLAKQEKHKEFEKLNNRYFQYVPIGAVELENLVPWPVLKAFLLKKRKTRAAQVLHSSAEYSHVRLGTWLETECNWTNAREDSGTLKGRLKKELADFVKDEVRAGRVKWTDFKENSHAEALTIRLVEFIKSFKAK